MVIVLYILENIRGLKRQIGLAEGIVEEMFPISARSKITTIRQITVLKVMYGTAYGEKAGVWYKVTFPEPLNEPVVVAVAEARSTTRRYRQVPKPPEVPPPQILKLPDVSKISISYPPNITFKRIERVSLTREEIENRIKNTLGDWGWLNWARDAIAYGMSFVLKFVYDIIVGAQLDKVEESVNAVVSDANAKINEHTKKIIDSINARIQSINSKINNQTNYIINGINDLVRKLNNNWNTQITYITTAINGIISDICAMWGIPEGVAITPVHVRNITTTGFEFLSLGKTKIYWIAIGKKIISF